MLTDLLPYLLAFLMGGLLCLIAQLLIDLTAITPAGILVAYVVFGVFLGAVGLFTPLKEIFGTGITVPIVGFGGVIAEGVRKAIGEVGLLGALTGGFTAASAGCAAALCFGFLFAVFFSGRPKKL